MPLSHDKTADCRLLAAIIKPRKYLLREYTAQQQQQQLLDSTECSLYNQFVRG
jgi:CRISPR/Cas system-associated protein Csm6